MDVERSFLANPEGTREEMLQATYLALCEHGYADLTVERIGDHFDKSMSLLYQHYDGKDELLLAFLSAMLEEFEQSIAAPPADDADPAGHLDAILDRALVPDPSADVRRFEAAMVELRAQGAADDRYREQFTRHDRFFRDHLAAVVRAGIDEGVFRDVDPDRVAAFLFTILEGVRVHRTTAHTNVGAAVHDELDAYLDAVLYPERA